MEALNPITSEARCPHPIAPPDGHVEGQNAGLNREARQPSVATEVAPVLGKVSGCQLSAGAVACH